MMPPLPTAVPRPPARHLAAGVDAVTRRKLVLAARLVAQVLSRYPGVLDRISVRSDFDELLDAELARVDATERR